MHYDHVIDRSMHQLTYHAYCIAHVYHYSFLQQTPSQGMHISASMRWVEVIIISLKQYEYNSIDRHNIIIDASRSIIIADVLIIIYLLYIALFGIIDIGIGIHVSFIILIVMSRHLFVMISLNYSSLISVIVHSFMFVCLYYEIVFSLSSSSLVTLPLWVRQSPALEQHPIRNSPAKSTR